MDLLHQKQNRLLENIEQLGSVTVAFSSGVDSTFLLKSAHDVLGDKAVAITAHSCLFPQREFLEATRFCEKEGIEHIILESDVFAVEGFADNPQNRCYLCKKALFSKIRKIADEKNIPYILEGSNIDDDGDYRPGFLAVTELGIKSPLKDAGLTKSDIRKLSKELGLATHNKPSFACLASRFVYGEKITPQKLAMIEKAEQKLFDLGFNQVRVRIHGNIARIEIAPNDFAKIINGDTAVEINQYFQELGFLYTTLDLGGYQMGSMNKML